MKESSKYGSLLLFCLTSLLMYMEMPVVSLYVPAIIKVALMVVVVVLLSLDSNRSSVLKIAVKLVPVYIISFVNLLSIESGSLLATLYDLLGSYVISCVYLHLFIENKYVFSKKITICTVIIYLITAVTTILGNIAIPTASRQMATGMMGDNILYDSYRALNIGSFAFVYELVLPIAFLPFIFKQKILPSWLTLGIYILSLYCMYETQFTMALMCVLGYGVFFFVGYIRNQRSLFWYAVILSIILFVVVPYLLPFAARTIGDDIMSERFEEMGNMVSGTGADSDSDVGARQSLYMNSIKIFLENPITGGKGAGGHSLVLDLMAKYGIFGILLVWIMLRSIFKIYIRPYRHSMFYGYLLLSYIVYLVLVILNPAPLYMSITFFVPLIAYVLKTSFENRIIK